MPLATSPMRSEAFWMPMAVLIAAILDARVTAVVWARSMNCKSANCGSDTSASNICVSEQE